MPDDSQATDASKRVCLTATVDAIGALGLRVDDELWPVSAQCSGHKCSQCHSRCTDSP